ncbi:hypothetical protein [Undibacterium sp.]|uniref:hypothetical protein n=1 Tax=Undibacterium sp. TaxID=1914977 RepID=UPI002C51925D|nr:hypothetical protein [Undibacterium sp.]HTD04353.1 hypothetical protein [Undibacterium sp.]
MRDKKWETDETRCAQTTSVSDPFSITHKMQRPQRIKVKSNVKNNPNTQTKPTQFNGASSIQYWRIWLPLVLTLSLTFNRLEPRRLCGTENGSEIDVV